jgi:hypothetical protein
MGCSEQALYILQHQQLSCKDDKIQKLLSENVTTAIPVVSAALSVVQAIIVTAQL